VAGRPSDNGHTKIENGLLEALARTRIPGESRQVLDFIMRKTFGWNKQSDQLSLSQFVEGTGLPKPKVIRARRRLTDMNIITVAQKGNADALEYEINCVFSSWRPLPKRGTFPKRGTSVAQKGNASFPFLGPTKATTTKAPTTKESSASADAALAVDPAEPCYVTKKGRRLTGKRLAAFERFWVAFNYKRGKAEAADAWYDIPALTDRLVDQIVQAAEAEAKARPSLIAAGHTPKMAQGWISGRRWEDEPSGLTDEAAREAWAMEEGAS